ncbi:MAG: SH3 domain-containing protein [Anaerolineae bacterium]|nr:SH3 domain-containing protein [Anaerolineae bacterium]
MPMTFEEAEARFKELQARVQRGEPISRAEYEEEVSKLAVQDRNGVLWEINPRTGKWMYFDGAEWVSGAPPGRDSSTVIPVPKEVAALKSTPPSSPAAPPPAPTPSPSAPPVTEPPPLVRTEPKVVSRAPSAPPKPAPSAPRTSRPAAGERRREWIPLAIASVVLLLCAATLFVMAQFVLPVVNPPPTPTRAVAITRVPTTLPPPTIMPTPTRIPPTPAPVIAKLTATTLNIRAEPNSKSARLGVLRKDNQVTFLAQTRGEQIEGSDVWYLINIPNSNQQGWVFFGNNFQIISGDPNTLPRR